MPDWLLAIAATIGVIVLIAVVCVLLSLASKAWQYYQDLRVWKK
jgi:hypothetical protein